jgi:hypothetical protein
MRLIQKHYMRLIQKHYMRLIQKHYMRLIQKHYMRLIQKRRGGPAGSAGIYAAGKPRRSTTATGQSGPVLDVADKTWRASRSRKSAAREP